MNENFKNNFNNDRITLANIDVTNKDSIIKSFNSINELYDIIIEDTTHQFEDQIRVIENTYQYLKPGGIMIIEDIQKSSIDYNDKESHFSNIYPEFKENYPFLFSMACKPFSAMSMFK